MSNKPAPLEAQLCIKTATLLKERHGPHLAPDEAIEVNGELAHGHARVGMVMVPRDRSTSLTLETVVELDRNNLDHPGEARDLALNALDAILGEFLASERLQVLPPAWTAHGFEGREVLVRGAYTRPQLDDEASRLLAEAGFDEHGDPT